MHTAAIATLATTAAAALCGAVENGNPVAPVNAVSHIAWGESAARRDTISLKYTCVGAALNAAAMLSWAAFHYLVFKPAHRRTSPVDALLQGAATAAIAYVVDYHLVPKRLTPGFEKRLSNRSLFAIYAALGASLAAGARTASDRPSRRGMALRGNGRPIPVTEGR